MKTFTFAAALAAMLAAPCVAQERTMRVSHADLDLANAEHRTVLERRIGRVLERVCGSYAAVANGDADSIGDCRRSAMADAGRQVERLAARQATERLAGR